MIIDKKGLIIVNGTVAREFKQKRNNQ